MVKSFGQGSDLCEKSEAIYGKLSVGWRCSISNNIVRAYAVGRKYLFHDTVKGAHASSIIYNLVEIAKLNNLNIYAYLETVLLYMPDYKNGPEDIEELADTIV